MVNFQNQNLFKIWNLTKLLLEGHFFACLCRGLVVSMRPYLNIEGNSILRPDYYCWSWSELKHGQPVGTTLNWGVIHSPSKSQDFNQLDLSHWLVFLFTLWRLSLSGSLVILFIDHWRAVVLPGSSAKTQAISGSQRSDILNWSQDQTLMRPRQMRARPRDQTGKEEGKTHKDNKLWCT